MMMMMMQQFGEEVPLQVEMPIFHGRLDANCGL